MKNFLAIMPGKVGDHILVGIWDKFKQALLVLLFTNPPATWSNFSYSGLLTVSSCIKHKPYY